MKRYLSLALVLALLCALCACGKSTEPVELDAEGLVEELLGSGVFSVSLDELPEGRASVFYSLAEDKLASARMYHAAGVSKEQLAVFELRDEKDAADAIAALQGLVEEWIESDRNYAPEEVPKLEKAIYRQRGAFVIFVVANDPDAAVRIVDTYL